MKGFSVNFPSKSHTRKDHSGSMAAFGCTLVPPPNLNYEEDENVVFLQEKSISILFISVNNHFSSSLLWNRFSNLPQHHQPDQILPDLHLYHLHSFNWNLWCSRALFIIDIQILFIFCTTAYEGSYFFISFIIGIYRPRNDDPLPFKALLIFLIDL